MEQNNDKVLFDHALYVAAEVQRILGDPDCSVGAFQEPAEAPTVLVSRGRVTKHFRATTSPIDIATVSRYFFRPHDTSDETAHIKTENIMDMKQKLNTAYGAATHENIDLAQEVDRLLVQNNFLIQRIDSLVAECNDLDRLQAENLDLKRKLRDARSEVTRYQKEYIDLLERRGQ